MKNLLNYLIAVAWIAIVAAVGGLFTSMGLAWLNTLTKPTQWIGGTVISIVWTVIYICLALNLIVLIGKNKLTATNIALYIANGTLNMLWCLLFFTVKSPLLGLVVIVINAVSAFMLVLENKKVTPATLYLSIYPLWVTIATCLNLAIWVLN